MRPRACSLGACLALFLAFCVPLASAQTFTVAFQKLSDSDDSVDDFRSGFPATRQCPPPCQTVHYICRIVNCASAQPDGTCVNPNASAVTGGVFTDTPPPSLPLDCSRGVTISGTGTSDPATCDPATNTVDVGNIRIPPGGSLVISFWSNVNCANGAPWNHAFFDYDQNPGASPIEAKDPVAFGGTNGLFFRVGDPAVVQPSKDAPALPIQMDRRIGGWGVGASWVIEGQNTNCDAQTLNAIWDDPDPDGCLTVDCSTLRFFINGAPAPLPPGSSCPDTVRGMEFGLGAFTLQPFDSFRIEFDALFTSDQAVGRCCNTGFAEVTGLPLGTTVDPRLDTGLSPEATCTWLAVGTATVIDAIKDAEDAAGNVITSVQPGDDVYWHFSIENQGGDPIDVDLSDDFPPAAVLDPATSIVLPFPTGTCTIVGQHLQCTAVNVPPSSRVDMRVRTAIDCSLVTGGQDVCNEATVSSGTTSATTHCSTCLPTPPANMTCVTMNTPTFEFASKDATDATGNGLAAVGETVTYAIHALNSGSAGATGVVVDDAIPAGTTYVAGTLKLDGVALTDAADGDAGEVIAGVVTVRVGAVAVLDFATGNVTFDVRVDSQQGAQLCNGAATVAWNEGTACGAPPQQVPPACLDWEPVVAQPDLSSSKSVVPLGAVDPGALLHYAIGTCNGAAGSTATNVAVTDAIPAGATYVPGSLLLDGAPLTDAADADAGELLAGPAAVRVRVGDVVAGACHVVELDVTVDAGVTADVVNVASVAADSVTPFDTNAVSTPIRPPNPPDVSITKSSLVSGDGVPRVGSAVTYTLQACNAAGTTQATGVVVTDPVPFDAPSGCGTTYVPGSLALDGVPQTDAADGDAGRFEPAPLPGGIVVDVGTLDPGQCVSVKFDVSIEATCRDADPVSNTGTVSSANAPAAVSNATLERVVVPQPPEPHLMRKIGGPLANRCTAMPTPCGCEVGDRLDPVADDCETPGACARVDAVTWRVPGDVDVRVPLIFYELHGGGCQASGDPNRLAVTKSAPDIVITLVP